MNREFISDERIDGTLINNKVIDNKAIDHQVIDGQIIEPILGKPSREQFVIGPYQVQHLPTGAKFGAYPGEGDIGYISWGLSECCATPSYRDELQKIARELLRERARY
jgi:hypothetical protein